MQLNPTITPSMAFPPLPVLIDPLEWCLAHGKINHEQYEIGQHFRRLYERAETVSVAAIDYSRPRVDGSMLRPDSAVLAADNLERASRHLGQSAYSLLRVLVGQGRPISEVAATIALQTGEPTREASAHVRMALRTALDDLARYWRKDA